MGARQEVTPSTFELDGAGGVERLRAAVCLDAHATRNGAADGVLLSSRHGNGNSGKRIGGSVDGVADADSSTRSPPGLSVGGGREHTGLGGWDGSPWNHWVKCGG